MSVSQVLGGEILAAGQVLESGQGGGGNGGKEKEGKTRHER